MELTKRETWTIIGYLEMDFEVNKMLIIKMLSYAQQKGWYQEVDQYIQNQEIFHKITKRDFKDLIFYTDNNKKL